MTDFDSSGWADREYSKDYLDHADHYIPDRFYLFQILRSFYKTFVAGREHARVCDLGCGDGILTDQLLREDASLEVTLVDGSSDMLAAARDRFKGRPKLQFLQREFAGLIADSSALGRFDFIVSSFAIHHLHAPQRRELFAGLLQHLEPQGWFMNIETAHPDRAGFTEWYYKLWQEWIVRRGQMLGHGEKYRDIPRQARENPDNHYSPLADQIADLQTAGFAEVECFYRNGIFAVYAGRKP